MDEGNAERYEDNKEKFSNPENKYYKQLYYFNILPIGRSIEIKENGLSKNQLIFLNSGLYDVENFIRIYVNDYSAYNKCRQAKLFLYKMIELIANKIDEKTESLKKLEKNNRDMFTDSEKKLKEKIEEKINKFSEEIKIKYEDILNNIPLDSYLSIDGDEFKKREKEIYEMLQECNGLTDLKNNDKYEKKHLRDHLSKNFKEVVKREKGSFAKLIQETKDDSIKIFGIWKEVKEKTKTFKNDSYKETIKMIKKDFTSRCNEAHKDIDEKSKKFWTEKTSEIKDDLIALVTDSEGLEEKQKRNLEDVLINFEDLNLSNVATDNFDEGRYTGLFSYRVKFERVETTFKNEMRNTIDAIREKIKKQHFKSFKDWINKLKNSILG